MNPQEFALQRIYAPEYDKPTEDLFSIQKTIQRVLVSDNSFHYFHGNAYPGDDTTNSLIILCSTFCISLIAIFTFCFSDSSSILLHSFSGLFAASFSLFFFVTLIVRSCSFAKNSFESIHELRKFFDDPLGNDKYLVGQAAKLFNQRADLFQQLVECVEKGVVSKTEDELKRIHSVLQSAYTTIIESLATLNSAIEAQQSLVRLQLAEHSQARRSLSDAIISLEAMSSWDILEEESLLQEARIEIEQDI